MDLNVYQESAFNIFLNMTDNIWKMLNTCGFNIALWHLCAYLYLENLYIYKYYGNETVRDVVKLTYSKLNWSSIRKALQRYKGDKKQIKKYYKLNYHVDVLDFICDRSIWLSPVSFHVGNVVKYIVRAGKKEGNSLQQDVKKAQDYTEKLYVYGRTFDNNVE